MKYIKTPEFVVAILFFLFLALGMGSRISIENVKFIQDGVSKDVTLPFSKDMKAKERFVMEFDVVDRYDFSYDMWIIPDDCANEIIAGEVSIDLSGITRRCDYTNGFTLTSRELASYRQKGKTHYSVALQNQGGPGGIKVFLKTKSVASWVINAAAVLLFAALFVLLVRRARLRKSLLVMLFIGIVFRTAFFIAIPYTTFAMDVDGHMAYIQYIAEKHAIPGDHDCWSCYHPPVYYVASVPSYLLSGFWGMPGSVGLQGFSLLLSVLTTFFGVLFLRSFLEGRNLLLASFLWIFWPLMIMVAPRVGNDQLFFLLHVLCLWGGMNYVKGGRGKYLIVAVIATALAMWTKMTAVVSLGMLVVFAVSGFFVNARSLKPTKSEVVAWSLFVLLIVGLAIDKLTNSDLVGNINTLHSKLKVGNDMYNYLYFDMRSFLQYPFTSCWNPEMGREFFWNFLFKTSLFGEYEMSTLHAARVLATVMSVTLLGLVVYAARAFWKSRLDFVHWILVLHAFAFLAALMALRIKYPYACSGDFRYILPVLLSFCPFVAEGISLESSSVKWRGLGYALVATFALSTVFLYILVM